MSDFKPFAGNDNETVENIGFGELKLIQSTKGFRFGIDAVILADFANSINPDAAMIADFGTGNGIIPLILSHKNSSCHITGFDIQKQSLELAERSREINRLGDRIDYICCDVNDITSLNPHFSGCMDTVVMNPPYVARGSGLANSSDSILIARQETSADLEDFIIAAASVLKERGHLFMIHRPTRLVDIFYFGRKHRLEPKTMRFVVPYEGRTANLVLVHCVLGGGCELNIMNELTVRDSSGNYSNEIMSIYEKTR